MTSIGALTTSWRLLNSQGLSLGILRSSTILSFYDNLSIPNGTLTASRSKLKASTGTLLPRRPPSYPLLPPSPSSYLFLPPSSFLVSSSFHPTSSFLSPSSSLLLPAPSSSLLFSFSFLPPRSLILTPPSCLLFPPS